ncbi:hypothetical protein [Rhizobium leguminosarum]|uniref:hypothetical protein n=1 Tax=Rhizobium leguminosarum TaxID=384 RepID=UPI0012FAC05F|nr:hypothetical protein [Rhizobium leguminosarum]MVO95096.1 hypothetical protein [Rhizobium leguminosarum bv. phaseoli]
MSNDDNSYIFPPPPESFWTRIRNVLTRSIESSLPVVAMGAVIVSFGQIFFDQSTDKERYWQFPDQEYNHTITKLDDANTALSSLAPLLQSNPEAAKILENARLSVEDSAKTLRSLPYVERRADIMPSFISTAYAQVEKQAASLTSDPTLRYIAFSLVGFVAMVYVVMLIMYGIMKDKTKNPFMERTLNQILGFLFGLITGVLSGQLR